MQQSNANMPVEYHFDDFTEENYRTLVKLAKEKYNFKSFNELDAQGKIILWRHDLDLSIHRALKLASFDSSWLVAETSNDAKK